MLVVVVLLVAVLVRAATRTNTYAARILHVVIQSPLVHARMPMTLVAPAGGSGGRPLLIFLHGRGQDQNSQLTAPLFSALHELGGRAPDLAFPYGGDHSYWHNRAGGAWASYVLDEALPSALRILRADPNRLAIGGISMGGFGAYNIARSEPQRFCAVGGHSAAIWPSGALSAAGAFDDAGDFAQHDVIRWAATHRDPYGRARLWLDGGSEDPFHQADATLAHELGIRMHVWPGSHDSNYWNAHWHDYLAFYANALANCH